MEHVMYRIPPSCFLGGFPVVSFYTVQYIETEGWTAMSNQLVGVDRRVHPYVLLFLARIDCYNNLVLLKNLWDRTAWGKGNVSEIPLRYETNQKIRLYLRLDVHALNPCSSTFYFGNFMAFIQKKINVRGEFAKDDFLDTLKNMATMPWWSLKIM